MNSARPLSIPVILGTVRKGRQSAHAARLVLEQLQRRSEIVTELIDIAELMLPVDDAGESIKDAAIADKLMLADALVIVSPEYNHSFPGLLKHPRRISQGVHPQSRRHRRGIGRSVRRDARNSGSAASTARIGPGHDFLGCQCRNASQTFDASGRRLDRTLIGHIDKFLDELIWMARTLRHGRDTIPLKS